jgi:hypothetical protein
VLHASAYRYCISSFLLLSSNRSPGVDSRLLRAAAASTLPGGGAVHTRPSAIASAIASRIFFTTDHRWQPRMRAPESGDTARACS